MAPDVEMTLALAVRQRRAVQLEYRYRGQGLRTVHPHALYPTANGTACDVYQVGGYTSKDQTELGEDAPDVRLDRRAFRVSTPAISALESHRPRGTG